MELNGQRQSIVLLEFAPRRLTSFSRSSTDRCWRQSADSGVCGFSRSDKSPPWNTVAKPAVLPTPSCRSEEVPESQDKIIKLKCVFFPNLEPKITGSVSKNSHKVRVFLKTNQSNVLNRTVLEASSWLTLS